jgi:PAS domain S-box-containing protein
VPQITLYSWLQALSAVLSAILGLLALRAARRRPAQRTTLLVFAAYMLSATVWSAGYGLMVSAETLPGKILGWQVTDVGAAVLPVFWVVFALSYTGRDRWLSRGVYAVLGTVTVGFAAVVVVDPVSTLLRPETLVPATDPLGTRFLIMERSFAPLFLGWAAWSHLLVLVGAGVFASYLQTGQVTYRGQATLLLVAPAVPLAASLVFFAGLSPNQLNFTSLSFTVSGLVFWVAMRRYRLLDVVPIARESVIDDMRDGYVVVDERGVVVDANPAVRRLTVGDGPRIGDPITDVLPESTAVLDGEAERTEVVVETDDGTRYLELSASELTGRNDEGTLLVLQDITERRSTERHYQTLIEQSSDLILVLDSDGTIRYESQSAERVLGYDPEERVGENAFENIHPEDRERLAEEFERGVEESGYVSRFEYRIEHADGSWRTHEAIARNLLGHPHVEGIVVNARDITERKRREQELREERERLDRFASVVSHDLRNPLTVVDGHVELLDDHVAEEGREHLDAIRRGTERMSDIVDDALTMAREERAVESVEQVSLAAVAREAWQDVATDAATLAIETDATVEADRTRLVRVFENLFRNAVEHGSTAEGTAERPSDGGPAEGTAPLTVTVRDCADGFVVEDDGIGISDEVSDDLFSPGVSGENSGTGLGLAIVAEIVQAHDWSIRAETSDDGGARFVVETGREAS